MELIDSFVGFYETVADDCRISPTHISLYMALLHFWNLNNCENTIYAKRHNVMKIAKISARRTYNKRIRELHEYGYIKYFPSSNPFISSAVYLKDL